MNRYPGSTSSVAGMVMFRRGVARSERERYCQSAVASANRAENMAATDSWRSCFIVGAMSLTWYVALDQVFHRYLISSRSRIEEVSCLWLRNLNTATTDLLHKYLERIQIRMLRCFLQRWTWSFVIGGKNVIIPKARHDTQQHDRRCQRIEHYLLPPYMRKFVQYSFPSLVPAR